MPKGAGSTSERWAIAPRFRGPQMPKGPTPRSGRLSKKASDEAGGAQASTSGRRSTVVGPGRGALGPKAGAKASMGTGGQEARCSLQERLQVDLSLRLRAARKWRGLLADRTYGQRKAVLDGSAGVR